MTRIVDELITALGTDVVTRGNSVDKRYWCDWSAIDPTRPLALIRPRSTADVSTALRLCHAAGQPVVLRRFVHGVRNLRVLHHLGRIE